MNAQENMDTRGIEFGFGFLKQEASFDIQFSLIDYDGSMSYARAYLVGLLNTLLVSFIGIILSTLLGAVIGVARLSPNYLINKTASFYIEFFRNIPLLLQIFFWYFAALRALPMPEDAPLIFGSSFMTIKGLYTPAPVWNNFDIFLITLIIALVIIFFFNKFAKKKQEEEGKQYPKFLISLGIFVILPALTFIIGGVDLSWSFPELKQLALTSFTYEGGVGIPPERVSGLNAFDHPDDDGTAIDISWNRSLATDFSFYTIWVSDFYQENLTESWINCADSPQSCGLISINQQQIGGAFELQLTVYTAHYGDSVSQQSSSSIIPEIPLYVTITTHDINGNVFLTDMQNQMVLVIPSDNSGDVFPPARIEAPQLSDRPSDDGDGVFVTFQESDESDISEYWIYADTVPFSSLDNRQPALVLSRDLEIPVLLERFSDGSPLAPNIMFWVSIIPVDSSGNYWDQGVKTSSIALINENILDPGLHIPKIGGVIAYWDSAGSRIQIEWDQKNDPIIESYYIYLSSTPFEDTRDADTSQLVSKLYSSYSWKSDVSQNIDGNEYSLDNCMQI